ncbi:MAG: DUF2948 family protein [Alphaproteobacteria bacterium]|nr:DUF2948 family protein [Alphaproteobacteria bacterium]
MKGRPTLRAEDADDLQILSARLQDAVARVCDLVWLPKGRRFAALFNRFKWEDAQHRRENLRIRAGIRFEHVLSARSNHIRYDDPEAILSLLAMRFSPNEGEDPGGVVELVFSGGGVIQLQVEYIEASLSDISGEWAARGRPAHPVTG